MGLMSLLDKAGEDVTVYPEVTAVDADGNTLTRASSTGIPARATVQLAAQSGTSARRSEQDNEGYETEAVYRIRFARSFPHVLGAQAQIEWRGVRWSVLGDARIYNGSKRTRHVDYTIRRS